MPRIVPEYRSRLPLPVTESPMIPLGSPVGEALERGGAQIADVGMKANLALQNARSLQELTQFKVEAAKGLSDLYDQSVNSPDFHTDPESTKAAFDQKVGQLNSALSSRITDPQVKAHFDEYFGMHSLTFARELQNSARKQRIAITKGALASSLDDLDTLAGRSASNEELSTIIKTGLSAIDDHAKAGVIEADNAPKLKKQFIGRIGTRIISRETRVDPASTLAGLLKGVYDSYLDESQKEKAIERAQRQVDLHLRQQDLFDRRKEAMDERARRLMLDRNEMDLFSRLAPDVPNRLTRQELEDAREKRLVDANGYRALSNAMEHDAGVDNKQILFDLESEIDSGRIDDDRAKQIRDRVYNLTGSALSHKTAGGLLDKLRRVSREDDISKTPGYRDAHEFIKTQLTTTGPLEALNQDDESRRAYALREFDQRARNGEDLWSIADDVVRRGKKTPVSAPFYLKPRFLEGPDDDMAALDAAEKATVERFKTGQLSPDLFRTEINAIGEFRKAAQLKIQAEAGKKPGDSKIKRR